jgi:hypothetical protein
MTRTPQKLLHTAQTAAAAVAASAADPSPQPLHVILHAFTANNVIANTIQSWLYNLGTVPEANAIDLPALERALSAYTVPEGFPEWKLPLLLSEGQFSLSVELIGNQQFHQLPLHY